MFIASDRAAETPSDFLTDNWLLLRRKDSSHGYPVLRLCLLNLCFNFNFSANSNAIDLTIVRVGAKPCCCNFLMFTNLALLAAPSVDVGPNVFF